MFFCVSVAVYIMLLNYTTATLRTWKEGVLFSVPPGWSLNNLSLMWKTGGKKWKRNFSWGKSACTLKTNKGRVYLKGRNEQKQHFFYDTWLPEWFDSMNAILISLQMRFQSSCVLSGFQYIHGFIITPFIANQQSHRSHPLTHMDTFQCLHFSKGQITSHWPMRAPRRPTRVASSKNIFSSLCLMQLTGSLIHVVHSGVFVFAGCLCQWKTKQASDDKWADERKYSTVIQFNSCDPVILKSTLSMSSCSLKF